MTVARALFVLLGLAIPLIPVLAPQPEGVSEEDGWFTVAAVCSVFFFVLTFYAVLPASLRTPEVSPGGVLTAITMRGPRHLRLDALTKVGAVEPASRGTPALYVWLRDADGTRILAIFTGLRPLPGALRDGAAALAHRDPGAVSSRARHYLDLPDAPRRVRRWTQAAITLVVGMSAVLTLLALAVIHVILVFAVLR